MKIALTAYLHGRGGAERQIIMLANALCNRGHEVHLLVLGEFNNVYKMTESIIVHDLTYTQKSFLHPVFRRYIALCKTYLDIKPDITIHYNIQPAWMVSLMPRFVYKKSIYSERGDPYDKEYSGIYGLFRGIAMHCVDGFVFQSEGARDFFNKSVKKRSVIIHNSVSINENIEKDLLNCENYIINVGRLHEQKNQALLISAFSKISNEYPDLKLKIYGDGKLRDKLIELIKTLHLEKKVFICPSTDKIFKFMVNAKMFVLTSDYEGMPNVLMEAMALGVPCISTDCRPGGAKALIEDGINGFIVPRNDEDSLVKKMRFLLNNDSIVSKISREAKKIRYTHTEKETFDKWECFIKQVCRQTN